MLHREMSRVWQALPSATQRNLILWRPIIQIDLDNLFIFRYSVEKQSMIYLSSMVSSSVSQVSPVIPLTWSGVT